MICDCCGAALLGRPHPIVVSADGAVEFRRVVCVRCRDVLLPAALQCVRAADESLRLSAPRV